MSLSRRAFAAALLASTALAACGAVTPSQVANDIIGADNAAQGALGYLAAQNVAIPASITTALTSLAKAAAGIAANPAGATASVGQTVVSDIEAVLPALTPLVALVPPPYGAAAALALGALSAFLPAIAGAFGLTAAAAPAPASLTAKTPLPVVSLADARAKYAPR